MSDYIDWQVNCMLAEKQLDRLRELLARLNKIDYIVLRGSEHAFCIACRGGVIHNYIIDHTDDCPVMQLQAYFHKEE